MASLVRRFKEELATQEITDTAIVCYADDIAITCSHATNAHDLAERVLQLVGKVCRDLGLKISPSKTKIMHMFRRQPLQPLYLDGAPIEWVPTFDYLGIRLDCDLNMRALCRHLAARMTNRLLLMKRISGFTWGAPDSVLALFYRQAVRSLFDYAAPTLALTALGLDNPQTRWRRNKTFLNEFRKLESIQHQAARLILRVPSTTRIEILLLESGLPPLELRGKQLLTTHLTRTLSTGLSATVRKAAAYLQDGTLDHPHISHHLKNAITTLKGSHGLCIADSVPGPLNAPWASIPVEIRTTSITSAKANYSTPELHSLALEAIAQAKVDFPLAKTVYTDGSLNPTSGRAGAGIFIPSSNVNCTTRVSDFASTLDTELAAIHLALEELHESSVIIITDSLNATKEIARTNARHTLAGEIQIIISARHRAHLNTVLLWVPSHIGLAGNDQADRAALTGANRADVEIAIPPSTTKLSAVASRATINLWERATRKEQVRNPYSISWLWYTLVRTNIPPPVGLPASTQVAVNRFRTGYRRWIDVPNLQRCPCGTKIFNVAHILASCGAVDRSAISSFMEDSDQQLSDNRAALAILYRLSKTSWNPLARFYRQNIDVINSVGHPDPDPDD